MEKKPRFLSDLEKLQARNEWGHIDLALKAGTILCEGLRDKRALNAQGYMDVITASGRTYQLGDVLAGRKVMHVILLTDIDTRGDELAIELKNELERYSIACDIELRKRIFKLLRLKYFEELGHKLDEFYAQTQR